MRRDRVSTALVKQTNRSVLVARFAGQEVANRTFRTVIVFRLARARRVERLFLSYYRCRLSGLIRLVLGTAMHPIPCAPQRGLYVLLWEVIATVGRIFRIMLRRPRHVLYLDQYNARTTRDP